MDIHPIRNDTDHATALTAIDALWDAEEGSEDFHRLDIFATLVESYENKRWPVQAVDPIDAIGAAMDAQGKTRADLAALIGQSRATEILGRKRTLTLPMIRAISEAWNVPASLLVREYELV